MMKWRKCLDLKVLKIEIFLSFSSKVSPSFFVGVVIPYRPHAEESDAEVGWSFLASAPDRKMLLNFFYGKYLLEVGFSGIKPLVKWCDHYATGVGG